MIILIIPFLSLALSVSVEFAEQAPNHSENKIIRLEGESSIARAVRDLEQLEPAQVKRESVAHDEEQREEMITSNDASDAREQVPPTPPSSAEQAKWGKWIIEKESSKIEQTDAMQAFVQAKLGLNEIWVTIPPREARRLPDSNDGDTMSEEALETRMTIHCVDTPVIEPEERRIRKIEGLRSVEIPCGGDRKKYKFRTVYQGYNVASDADLGAGLLNTMDEDLENTDNRHPTEPLQDEHSSRVISATASAMSSQDYNANMDSINPSREQPSAAEMEDPKENDEEEILRLQLVTARDHMHDAMIKLSVVCRNYHRNNLAGGLEIIKKEINFMLSQEENSTWWTNDPPDDEEI